jgi:hypothetical protein
MGLTKLSLKDSLFLGFCAVFIIFSRATMRLHLGIPGHAMFFTIFFLMTAKGCVRHPLASTFTGFLAGIMAMVLGLGKSGPLMLLIMIMPALVIDASLLVVPAALQSYLLSGLIAAAAASTKFIQVYVMDLMTGMDKGVILQHALLEASTAVLFGIVGGLLIPPVIRKLKAFGVI